MINLPGVTCASLRRSEGHNRIRDKTRVGVASAPRRDGEDGIDAAPSHRFPPQIQRNYARRLLGSAQRRDLKGGERLR